jgi:hypothetical protein
MPCFRISPLGQSPALEVLPMVGRALVGIPMEFWRQYDATWKPSLFRVPDIPHTAPGLRRTTQGDPMKTFFGIYHLWARGSGGWARTHHDITRPSTSYILSVCQE